MDKQYDKRSSRVQRRPETKIHVDLSKMTLKNIKLENSRPSWNTCFLVRETHLHSRQTCTRNEQMPTKGTRTRMDDQRKDHRKDPSKRTAPNNYRSITCLPMIWKILTAQIREEIYYSLTSCGLFPEERKGCCKGSRGTAELLYIDQHILNESKTRRKNLAMAWIGYKKAYEMVPQSWIINSLKMYKISDDVLNFIEKTMKTWRVELTAGKRSLAEAKTQRGIFEGDALSPLLFMITMMPLNHILKKSTAGYRLRRSQEKINHLIYMDDIKLFATDDLETNTRSYNI